MKNKTLVFMLGCLMICLSLTGCSSDKSVSTVEKTPVRIAYFPNVTHCQALLGKQDGLYAQSIGDLGTVEWKMFNSGTPEIEAFMAGELDIGFIGPVPAINGFDKTNGDLQIIAGSADGGAILVARNDSGIKSLKDLAGKKVAVPSFGNTQDIMLRILLHDNNMKESAAGGDVDIVPVKNPDVLSCFQQKQVDAAFVPEPWGSQLIKEANATVVLDNKDIMNAGKYPTTVVIARKDFVQQHPDIVKKFLEAHIDITRNYNAEAAMISINKELLASTGQGIASDVLQDSLNRTDVTWNPNSEALQTLGEEMKAGGFFSKDMNINELLNLQIMNEVLKEKGL